MLWPYNLADPMVNISQILATSVSKKEKKSLLSLTLLDIILLVSLYETRARKCFLQRKAEPIISQFLLP
jgi:hypothetical protein